MKNSKEMILLVLFILSAFYAVRIAQLQHDLSIAKADAEMYRTRCVEMHTEMREYWRTRCGCLTVEEVMDAFNRPSPAPQSNTDSE
jgi:hypothetical protein